MLSMNYIGDSTIYPVEFSTISDRVVELKGDFPVKNTGFILSRINCKDNWNYSAYTTVYREIDGGVQFSNDGSIYTPPEPMPEPDFSDLEKYQPTPEELAEMEQRRKEAAAAPTNAELSEAVMEIAENISDLQDAVAELGVQVTVAKGGGI